MDIKELTVISGPLDDLRTDIVQLHGVPSDERLTPKLARQAARLAIGSSNRYTVWDETAGYGYRLYARSARKLYQDE